ncbi:MAG: glycosyltransferase [Spirochaetales bacterium]|nr:glycosyltransferase [Spirochaetales bacterium]
MNKRVTLLLNTFPSLSETFILNQVVGLKKKGWEVQVISFKKPNMNRVHPDFYNFNCEEAWTVIGLPSSLSKRMVKGLGLFLKLFVKAPSLCLRALNKKKYRTAASSLKNLFILDKLVGQEIPLLHAHFGPNGLVGSFLKDVGIVDKLIVTYHGSDINSYPRRYGHDVYHHLYKKADLITANTSFTKGKITNNGADPDNIAILPVGLNTTDYPLREDPPTEGLNGLRILTVGRLVEKKGYPWAIEAVGLLQAEFPGLTYHIVGDGPMKEQLKALVSEKGLESVISFCGSLNADEVRQEFSQAHVFVLASAISADGDMEGQGLVLQEAQSMGVPVVSTLHNGIPDGVLDEESGFLVPEKNSQALADKISLLLKDRDLRVSMGKAGNSFVRENYDMSVLTDKLEKLYSSVTGEQG